MLGVLGGKPGDGSDHLKGRLSQDLQCDTHQLCSLDAVMLLKIAMIGVRMACLGGCGDTTVLAQGCSLV